MLSGCAGWNTWCVCTVKCHICPPTEVSRERVGTVLGAWGFFPSTSLSREIRPYGRDISTANGSGGLGAIPADDSGGWLRAQRSAGVDEWVWSAAGVDGVGGGLKVFVGSQRSAGLGKWNLGVSSCFIARGR